MSWRMSLAGGFLIFEVVILTVAIGDDRRLALACTKSAGGEGKWRVGFFTWKGTRDSIYMY